MTSDVTPTQHLPKGHRQLPPTITVTDPLPGPRTSEPITFTLPGTYTGALWAARTSEGTVVPCQRLDAQSDDQQTTFITVLSFEGKVDFQLQGPWQGAVDGITEQTPREEDAHVRLDTGYFDLELCRGTAQGTGASKWGIRHFAANHEGIDLLPSGNNAIGGFYGPFFTPENGLINPPEHTTVHIEEVEKGPLLHHYRLHGTIPDGLLEELKGKSFTIDWRFTHGTPYFQRQYRVDDFQTVINGRSVTNKITVGDEFEGGPGKLVFDRFETHSSTRYRAGDPYAEELVKMVEETVATSPSRSEKFAEFREQLGSGMESAHWDLYWRMFCSWEAVLDEREIQERLTRVRAASHVRADHPERPWIIAEEPVDVSAVNDATIFPGAASKTVEFSSTTGRAMVWWTGQPSGAFQIVQRRESGWVNWGSNGENECPELPVGTPIKTAYGHFVPGWRHVADQLEQAPAVTVSEPGSA